MVPVPSRGTILNTGTCSTVHYMPCPRQCNATESWGFWHAAMDLLLLSTAGGTYWPIAIRCLSLPSP